MTTPLIVPTRRALLLAAAILRLFPPGDDGVSLVVDRDVEAATGYGQRNLRNAWHDLDGLGALEWSRVTAGVRAVRPKDCPAVWAPAAASAEVSS